MWVQDQPLSLWVQLASLFFACSGLNGDLLIIRFFLLLAYLMLFLNAIFGSPLWPNVENMGGGVFLDSIIWSVIGLYVHGSSLVCLIIDERRVQLTDDQAALWRLLYRTGGLSQKLFETMIVPYLETVVFDTGENINISDYFYIIYEGHVRLQVILKNGTIQEDRIKCAGDMFDFKHLHLLQTESPFVTQELVCTAVTPHTKLFRFKKEAMIKIAHHKFAKSCWQALLINDLSNILEECMFDVDGVNQGVNEDNIFGPLREWEIPQSDHSGSGSALTRPIQHLWRSARRSFSMPWPWGGHPTGIRQTQLRAPSSSPQQHANKEAVVLLPARCLHCGLSIQAQQQRRETRNNVVPMESSFNTRDSNCGAELTHSVGAELALTDTMFNDLPNV